MCVTCGTGEQCHAMILITCAVSTETKRSCKKNCAREKFYTVSPETRDSSVCAALCVLFWFDVHNTFLLNLTEF